MQQQYIWPNKTDFTNLDFHMWSAKAFSSVYFFATFADSPQKPNYVRLDRVAGPSASYRSLPPFKVRTTKPVSDGGLRNNNANISAA